MRQRKQINELRDGHLRVRKYLNDFFTVYDTHKANQTVMIESDILKRVEELKQSVTEKEIADYYIGMEYILKAIFFLIRWSNAVLNGNAEAEQLLATSKANAKMFLSFSTHLDLTRPSLSGFAALSKEIELVSNIDKITPLVRKVGSIAFPVFYTTKQERSDNILNIPNETKENEIVEPPIVISVLFYIDQELWANPQTLKKDHQYIIKGTLKFNKWPENYDKLILTYASTTNDEWFLLSLPEITQSLNSEVSIEGNIIFKYAQANFEAPISIKLLAQFASATLKPMYPQLIGYDELKVKIADLSSFPYLTGYDKLNQKALDIAIQIQNQVSGLANEEMNNFMVLFSAILNYQGYCVQYAEYKNSDSVSENDFRDKLIRYLAARNVTSISKEAHVAGGRVEINYNGIVAELKIEDSITDRDKIIVKYKKQPIAYSTATGSQLSILCILDVQRKLLPPGLTPNNVFLIKPEFHGFESTPVERESRLAVIIIDANMPDPSKY